MSADMQDKKAGQRTENTTRLLSYRQMGRTTLKKATTMVTFMITLSREMS